MVRVNFVFDVLGSFSIAGIYPFCFIQHIVLKYLQYNLPFGLLLMTSLIKYIGILKSEPFYNFVFIFLRIYLRLKMLLGLILTFISDGKAVTITSAI